MTSKSYCNTGSSPVDATSAYAENNYTGLSPSGKAQDFDSCISLVRIQLALLAEYGLIRRFVI